MVKLLPTKWPLIPTALVVAAIATMIALGFWQFNRAEEKDAMLLRYAEAKGETAPVPFPQTEADIPAALYRQSTVTCARVIASRSTAARDTRGDSGLAQVVRCELDDGGQADVFLGWTPRPQPIDWKGGTVSGMIAPSGDWVRLVADPPAFSLAPLPKPDPSELPNNHLAYAGQWFFFALTALVIYVMVLRRREMDE